MYLNAPYFIGYEEQTKFNIPITNGNSNEVSFEMQRAYATLGEVTVKGTRRNARATSLETPLSVQRLTTEEIKSNPGGKPCSAIAAGYYRSKWHRQWLS